MSVSEERFKQVMSRFATGVTVVTMRGEGMPHGLTVNAFASVSLRPPLVLICVQNEGGSYANIVEAGSFVVNILSEDQKELADRFANPRLDSAGRFKDLEYNLSERGNPVLRDIVGYAECRIAEQFKGGDHTIFLAEVEDAQVDPHRKPLLFFNSQYYRL